MIQILTQPKNSLVKQYKKLFQIDGVELDVTIDACKLIVDKTIDLNLGARGLRSVFETILLHDSFLIPSNQSVKKIIMDRNYVMERMSSDMMIKKAS